MRHIAIIGSGPAGYYTAEACQKAFGEGAWIDIIDRMPVPYGLIRTGVAPDHQSIKAVYRRYEGISLSDNVGFVGNVTVGRDVSVPELLDLYDAVVIATGAPDDNLLELPGGDLPGVIGSAAFVGWYNGHPEHAGLAPPLDISHVAIIGNGNVALDCARILAKTRQEFSGSDIVGHALDALDVSGVRQITLVGRRGPHQIAMTPKELGELGHLARTHPVVDSADFPPIEADAELEPGQRKSVTILRGFAAAEPDTSKPVTMTFDFFAAPVAVEGAKEGEPHAQRLIVERTILDENARARGTGEQYAIEASLVISCIGYRTPPIPDIPYDAERGRFANDEGRISPGLYCVGWARRGPTGTIGTNKPDGFMIADKIAADLSPLGSEGSGKAGRAGLDALLGTRGVAIVTFSHWQAIDQAEVSRAREDSPREKFTSVAEMIAAIGVS